jgi:hypothetical protein
MFLQLARKPGANTWLNGHPEAITTVIEHYWNNRPNNPAIGRPQPLINGIANNLNVALPAPPFYNDWDHIAYAWAIENTRIYDIFAKVLKTYRVGEQLGRPRQSYQFWNITEALFFSAPPPTTIWGVTSSVRPDERSQRMLTYSWMLGLPVTQSPEGAPHTNQKPTGANVEFASAFETFASEVRRGIVNRRNRQGANDTDNEAMASEARRIRHMFETRRASGNLLREEFRAVAIMSWLHLAVSSNTPAVNDLAADGSSEAERLWNIADRVGMTPHPKSEAFFGLAQPFSRLLQWIEAGDFDTARDAASLYNDRATRGVVETVIGQYSKAVGRDLKAIPVSVSPSVTPSEKQLSPSRPLQLVAANPPAGNSQTAQSG